MLGKDFPRIAETTLDTSADGRFLLATVKNGDGGEAAQYLRGPSGSWSTVAAFADHAIEGRFGPDGALYLLSYKGSPRGRILRLSPGSSDLAAAQTAVAEGQGAIDDFCVTKDRIYVADLVGGPSSLRVLDAGRKGGRDGGDPPGLVRVRPGRDRRRRRPLREPELRRALRLVPGGPRRKGFAHRSRAHLAGQLRRHGGHRGNGRVAGRHARPGHRPAAKGDAPRRLQPDAALRLRGIRHQPAPDLLRHAARLARAGRRLRGRGPARRRRVRRGLAPRREPHAQAERLRRLPRLGPAPHRRRLHAPRQGSRSRAAPTAAC